MNPADIASEYDRLTIRPLKLEGKAADEAVKALVSLGLRCRVSPESNRLKSLIPTFETSPPFIACEKKLRDDLNGYPWLYVDIKTTWLADSRKVSELFASLGDTIVRGVSVTGLNPFYAVNDVSAVHKAQRDLDKSFSKNSPEGSSADATSKLVAAGFYCGIALPRSSDSPSIVCSAHWPTDSCRIGLAELSVAGPPIPTSHAANLLWSKDHTVLGWKWICLDPTNDRNEDMRVFARGPRPNFESQGDKSAP